MLRRMMVRLFLGFVVGVSLMTGGSLARAEQVQGHPDQEQLENFFASVPGLEFEKIAEGSDLISYELYFTQPEDHRAPQTKSFRQQLILTHRSFEAPVVLQTSGYQIFFRALSQVARSFKTNQIQVEHRFFDESIPEDPDWSKMTVWQSASDFHRIVETFKQVYSGKWLGTGRSKGGMTSVYHRHFFPDDIDVTLAHVAPHSRNTSDTRYADFLRDEIGGDDFKACRERLSQLQEALLKDVDKFTAVEGDFSLVGSEEAAREHASVDITWAFWQYAGPTNKKCSNVPGEDSSFRAKHSFMTRINGVHRYLDSQLSRFVPYYFQAAHQLGSPTTHLEHLSSLLRFEDTFTIEHYVPDSFELPYDGGVAMRGVGEWLRNDSERMIFVYGEFDPWTAGAFEPRQNASSLFFTVPEKNHSALFSDLEGRDRQLAYGKIAQWLGVSLSQSELLGIDEKTKNLEDLEWQEARPPILGR